MGKEPDVSHKLIRFNDTQLSIEAMTVRTSTPRNPFISDNFQPFLDVLKTKNYQSLTNIFRLFDLIKEHAELYRQFLLISLSETPVEYQIKRYTGERLAEILRLNKDDPTRSIYIAYDIEKEQDGYFEEIARCYLKNGEIDGLCSFSRYKHHPAQEFRCHSGKLNGTHETYHRTGQLYEQMVYRDNVAHGVCRRFYENGRIRESIKYHEGIFHGLYQRYYSNGTPMVEAHFVEGMLTGRVYTYHQNRKMREFIDYKEGRMSGHYQCRDSNGVLLEIANYIDGQKEGLCETFYDSGKLKSSIHYKNGNKNGHYRTFYETGQLKIEALYKDNNEEGSYVIFNEDSTIAEHRFYHGGQYSLLGEV